MAVETGSFIPQQEVGQKVHPDGAYRESGIALQKLEASMNEVDVEGLDNEAVEFRTNQQAQEILDAGLDLSGKDDTKKSNGFNTWLRKSAVGMTAACLVAGIKLASAFAGVMPAHEQVGEKAAAVKMTTGDHTEAKPKAEPKPEPKPEPTAETKKIHNPDSVRVGYHMDQAGVTETQQQVDDALSGENLAKIQADLHAGKKVTISVEGVASKLITGTDHDGNKALAEERGQVGMQHAADKVTELFGDAVKNGQLEIKYTGGHESGVDTVNNLQELKAFGGFSSDAEAMKFIHWSQGKKVGHLSVMTEDHFGYLSKALFGDHQGVKIQIDSVGEVKAPAEPAHENPQPHDGGEKPPVQPHDQGEAPFSPIIDGPFFDVSPLAPRPKQPESKLPPKTPEPPKPPEPPVPKPPRPRPPKPRPGPGPGPGETARAGAHRLAREIPGKSTGPDRNRSVVKANRGNSGGGFKAHY